MPITPITKPLKKVKTCKCGKPRKQGSSLCNACYRAKIKARKEELAKRKKERKINSVGYYNKQVKKLEKECDKAWSLKVREGKKCELCGRVGDIKGFDAHHLVHRANKATRWDVDNGACLCKACHRYKVHMDTMTTAILFEKLKETRGQGWFEMLDCYRYQTFKPDLNWLKNKLKELK